MKDWQELGSKLVLQAAKEDMEYLRLQTDLEQAEAAYLSVVSQLSKQSRETIERYIALCEESNYYETQLAWSCGRVQK